VLLLTDGFPNCNPNNAADPSVTLCTDQNRINPNGCEPRQLLDEAETVAAVSALRAKGIQTMVLGFGADLATGPGHDVLTALATAGEGLFPSYLQASNGDELAIELEKLRAVQGINPCVYPLEAVPRDDRFILVLVDGQRIPPSDTTWWYERPTEGGAKPQVVFAEAGSLCQRFRAATPDAPVPLEIRVIEKL
jgi:hypothetical protein